MAAEIAPSRRGRGGRGIPREHPLIESAADHASVRQHGDRPRRVVVTPEFGRSRPPPSGSHESTHPSPPALTTRPSGEAAKRRPRVDAGRARSVRPSGCLEIPQQQAPVLTPADHAPVRQHCQAATPTPSWLPDLTGFASGVVGSHISTRPWAPPLTTRPSARTASAHTSSVDAAKPERFACRGGRDPRSAHGRQRRR